MHFHTWRAISWKVRVSTYIKYIYIKKIWRHIYCLKTSWTSQDRLSLWIKDVWNLVVNDVDTYIAKYIEQGKSWVLIVNLHEQELKRERKKGVGGVNTFQTTIYSIFHIGISLHFSFRQFRTQLDHKK